MSDFELLKNINDIDDDLICEAENWKRPKVHKLRLALIAAAAALGGALLAVSGTAAINRSNEDSYVQAVDHPFYLKLEEQGINVPEEYRTTDERGHVWYNERMRGMLPSEVFAQFGVSPLLNDNFSEIVEFEPNHIYVERPNGVHELIDVDYGDPVVTIVDGYISFEYKLYNKITQRNIILHATYFTDELDHSDFSEGFEETELNDGSKCYYDAGVAFFYYEGVGYYLNLYDRDVNNLSVDLTIQTLEALGVC